MKIDGVALSLVGVIRMVDPTDDQMRIRRSGIPGSDTFICACGKEDTRERSTKVRCKRCQMDYDNSKAVLRQRVKRGSDNG